MMVVGQLGTKSKKQTLWHPENLAPGQFGIRTIWHPDDLAPGQLGTGQFGTRTICHQTFGMMMLNIIEYFWQHLAHRLS